MADKFIFHINEQCPRPQGVKSINRIIYSSFNRFETEIKSNGFSMKIPLEGKEKYIIDNQLYAVNPGEYFLANHGELVGYDLKQDQPIKGLCLYLDDDFLKRAKTACMVSSEKSLNDPSEVIEFADVSQGKYIFEEGRLRQLINQLTSGAIAEMTAEQTEQFFYDIALELGDQLQKDRKRMTGLNTTKKSTRQEIYLRLQIARQFIHDECHKPLSVKEISEVAMLSEFHFIRCFKSCFGISPYQYLLKVRVEKARELLLSQQNNMTEIATYTGFTDVFMFSKVFKKQTGKSPSMFYKRTA